MSLKAALKILSRKPRAKANAVRDDDESEDRDDDAPAEEDAPADDEEDPDEEDPDDAAEEGPDDADEEDGDKKKKKPAKKTASAAVRERARIAAILDAPAAVGREALARHLALHSAMKPSAAIAALDATPKTLAQPSLATMMAAVPNPDVGPGEPNGADNPAGARDRIAAMAGRIVESKRPVK